MRFDLSGETQGVWFKFFESNMVDGGEMVYLDPKEDAGEARIRSMDSDVLKGIKSKTSKRVERIVHNPKTRAMEHMEYEAQTPEQKAEENELFWDYVIQDWKGILDKDGNEIPCTPENKKLITKKSIQFLWFVVRCLQLVTGSNAERAEGAIKNS